MLVVNADKIVCVCFLTQVCAAECYMALSYLVNYNVDLVTDSHTNKNVLDLLSLGYTQDNTLSLH